MFKIKKLTGSWFIDEPTSVNWYKMWNDNFPELPVLLGDNFTTKNIVGILSRFGYVSTLKQFIRDDCRYEVVDADS